MSAASPPVLAPNAQQPIGGSPPARRVMRIAPPTGGAMLMAVCSLASAVDPSQSPSPVSAGGMMQVALGLMLVLALVVAVAWLLKRFAGAQTAAGGLIKVIAGAAVGSRERVVLIEVAGTWLVVGVAPGRVSALHALPKGEIGTGTNVRAGGDGSFPAWLRQVMEKRNGK